MVKPKELVAIEDQLPIIEMGNLACAGCQLNLSFKHTLSALGGNAIAVIPACCTSVIQGAGLGYGMHVPIFNTAFASAPAVASGIARKIKIDGKDTTVVVWAGDGGTADIGFASLSGAAERNENIIYVMYNNQGYQNTGNQKSGATPRAAKTTTTSHGKSTRAKHISRMMLAQEVPYVATANAAYPRDLFDKITRAAKEFDGQFRFIEIFSGCPPGWGVDTKDMVEVGKLATETGSWPLWEAVNGKLEVSRVNKKLLDKENRKDPARYFELQGRFRSASDDLKEKFREDIDDEWEWLKKFM